MNLHAEVLKLMHTHKNEILDSCDWWYSIDNYDINVFCYEDTENRQLAPTALFNINLYELDLGEGSSYDSSTLTSLQPMTRQEIRLL